ncbi:MAG: guanylate kinase [Chloroflexota bacterium]
MSTASPTLACAQHVLAYLRAYLQPDPVMVVLSGPSGVGKDSVVRRMRELGQRFHFVVTATDRPQRLGEVHGTDYYFVTTAEFERMIAAGELIEYARPYDQYKGVPKAHVRQALASGTDVLMRVDVQGAAAIKRLIPATLTVMLLPPSLEALTARLCGRGGDSPAQVQQRLEIAIAEMERVGEFDYAVVNHEGQLDEAARQIAAIIRAEKQRVGRSKVNI